MFKHTFKASYLMVRGLSDLTLEYGIDSSVRAVGVSRLSGKFISELPLSEINLFCQNLVKRRAVMLDIDYPAIVRIAELTAGFSFGQYAKLLASNESWVKSMPIGLITYRQAVVESFFNYLFQVMYDIEHHLEQVSIEHIPPELFVYFQKLNPARALLLFRLIVQRNLIRVKVSKHAVDLVVASFKPGLEERQWMQSLVKAGAPLDFIEKYGERKYVDTRYYHQCKQWQKNTWKPEEVESDMVFEAFERLMAGSDDVIAIYMALHYEFELRIETLYRSIQNTLNQKYSHDDYLLHQEVTNLLNQ